MDSNLALILMTATFVLGVVYGALPKPTRPALRKAPNQLEHIPTRPIDATFVALFSTHLPRYARPPLRVEKRVPERYHWIEAENDN